MGFRYFLIESALLDRNKAALARAVAQEFPNLRSNYEQYRTHITCEVGDRVIEFVLDNKNPQHVHVSYGESKMDVLHPMTVQTKNRVLNVISELRRQGIEIAN